jgi:nitrogen fixation NifU-like protein
LYSPELLDHFANPRNAGELENPTYRLSLENPVCGDQLRVTVLCEGERIEQVRFLARGCTASIACASALTELLQGRDRRELAGIRAAQVEEAVGGLIQESKHAAVLCADVVKKLEAEWKKS